MNLLDNDKQVYWDEDKNEFYWIEWIYTGNNDIPKRHYILEKPQDDLLYTSCDSL